jgi:hypothetical protein
MTPPELTGTLADGPLTRSLAVQAAIRFVRDEGQSPPIDVGSARPFVLDLMSREWHVLFQEEANPYMALMMGSLDPQLRRVAVHAETGTCRWVADD